MAIAEQISLINKQLNDSAARLIVVTKTRSIEELKETYAAGAIEFGENRVQEMVEKQAVLPGDILWHQIGHLQTNKVKYIAPFVHLIHSVDSLNILKEINKQGAKNNRIINCLLQIFIATEESKFGLDFKEAEALLADASFAEMKHIRIVGLMGMASFTADEKQIRREFKSLADFFQQLKNNKTAVSTGLVEWTELSMGMSGDYLIAAELGATLVRVGSAIYGPRH
ncbi:YggS family pyridoxal phosphate-dependent enzyme [Aquirufa lenticrescens]|uniref:YggS family pyridoxal phosphate-dependent enzyme n=1 Tax=Aquirufa lenticrescens TaxID=2696560 RepID=UPI001CAA5CAA|nr:YggS family pyridoxal phosphate-dependent enzyme [Aquirufa lenticrescens]UAJ13340.1 YggS family pyridoxal phosphate-dependent enzyme [Aquirufa lenticrescens]